MMMNCIPGISTKVSSRLSSRYKTLKDFIEILDKIETNEFRIKFIQDIRLENENKSRKISKNVAENIVNYLGYKLE